MTARPLTYDQPAHEAIRIDARRIALLSDTHFMAGDGGDVPQSLLDMLDGVDLILHLGHVSSPGALDRLETVAPVLAVQTELDDQLMGERLAGETDSGRTRGYTRVIESEGVRIGLVHDFSAHGIETPLIEGNAGRQLAFPDVPMEDILSSRFGSPVHVVACAATHDPFVLYRDGVLLVNPGSPNLPDGRRKGGPGAFALLTIDRGTVAVEVIDVDPSS
jgi:putative phosphoesterase